MMSFFNSLYTITKAPKKLKAIRNAVDLVMDLLLSSEARKHRRSAFITNLKTRTFAKTMVTSKKLRILPEVKIFCSNLYDASGMI